MTDIEQNRALLGLTADIVSAHVKNNLVETTDLPALIGKVYAALRDAASAPVMEEPAAVRHEPERAAPVVSPKKSVFPDYIICLEDGRKLKTLKRYLRSTYSLTPEQYREKWDLPADYPMVAPNYAEHRSALAKKLGLGRKRVTASPLPDAPELPLAQPEPARERARDTAADRPREPAQDRAPDRAREQAPPPAAAESRDAGRDTGREPRTDHTAASVFAKFPRAQEAAPEEPGPSTLDGGKSRRKPFSKQLARTMRP